MIERKMGIVRGSIEEFCKASGVKKSELAEAAGVERQRIQNFERMDCDVKVEYHVRSGEFSIVRSDPFTSGKLPKNLKFKSN